MRRALLSVYDKTGIAAFAQELHRLGFELVASGGTAAVLADDEIPTVPLEELTGFAEMLGHRVVTLHPAIHGGILARRDVPEDVADLETHGITPIDLVCVNLYPFEQTVGRLDVEWDDAIEQIDVGGPALLRAAAKNHAHVVPVCRPDDYELVLQELRGDDDVSVETRRALALTAFTRTASYDAAVAGWLGRGQGVPETFVPVFDRALEVSYGENPHQGATYYEQRGARTHVLARVEQLHGKPLSFNNVNDLSAARLLMIELDGPACVIVKHANPCGVGVAESIEGACEKALASDPVSAYGGVVVLNRPVSATLGERLAEQFVEVLFAPGYDAVAMEALAQKPDVRILNDQERRAFPPSEWDFKRVMGGLLVQQRDLETRSTGWRWSAASSRRRGGTTSSSPGRSSSTRSRTRS
jgi:phosphoribosylaminoimidazolecarboxamide formyltransferase/IMP cyclohydrolase